LFAFFQWVSTQLTKCRLLQCRQVRRQIIFIYSMTLLLFFSVIFTINNGLIQLCCTSCPKWGKWVHPSSFLSSNTLCTLSSPGQYHLHPHQQVSISVILSSRSVTLTSFLSIRTTVSTTFISASRPVSSSSLQIDVSQEHIHQHQQARSTFIPVTVSATFIPTSRSVPSSFL
jgi:hypothetical protein